MKLSLKTLRNSLLVLLAAGVLIGCSTEEESSQHAGSSLPWNRPQSWEGGGALGSAMQGSR
ncbi:MAG: hypothetical protein NTZ94_12145 [Verrucomicrobia bacterium]|nr:hypothetical protein [Verrucomicrobiota bacterium]NBR49821.1 hypothetical protein [bacterium]NBS52035.1 hypothetical protein [Spartobacteria bacterium]